MFTATKVVVRKGGLMEWNRFAASIVIVIVLLLSFRLAHTCPTCVGRITDKSAPFFSDDAYRHDSRDNNQNQNEERDEVSQTVAQADETGEGLLW